MILIVEFWPSNSHFSEPVFSHVRLNMMHRTYSSPPIYVNECKQELRNSYTMGCLPVRGDNPRALASGLSYVQVDKHGITILYHLQQCRLCTS